MLLRASVCSPQPAGSVGSPCHLQACDAYEFIENAALTAAHRFESVV